MGLSLTARTDANDSALVADVDSLRAAIVTTLTDIVGVPPTAVARLVLRLPDCTQVALEPRLPKNTTSTRRRRELNDMNDGTGAVPCTPTVGRMQVLLVVDTGSIGGNATVETAVARGRRVWQHVRVHCNDRAAVHGVGCRCERDHQRDGGALH